MKNHIEKVWIERQIDEQADTSFIGEYTDKKEAWVICRHCGEFVAIAEAQDKRADEIEWEIYDLEMEDEIDENKIDILKTELENLDLHNCGHWSREYNYFKPYAGGEEEGSETYQKYGKQDFERMESLYNGNWCFIGIIAKAEIRTESGTMQVIRSGGLWGIESDSEKSYLDEVGKDELENLRLELTALGFGKRAINKAYQSIETKDK